MSRGKITLQSSWPTYGPNCVLRGVPIPVLQKWLGRALMVDTQR